MQYNVWGVRDIDGYDCFVFEKDPSSVGLGVFNWRRVYDNPQVYGIVVAYFDK